MSRTFTKTRSPGDGSVPMLEIPGHLAIQMRVQMGVWIVTQFQDVPHLVFLLNFFREAPLGNI